MACRGRFALAGLDRAWFPGRWVIKGGLLLQVLRRVAVDDILAERGDPVYRRNRFPTLEAGYRATDRLGAIAREPQSRHLFVSDLPVICSSRTSGRFGGRLSLFTLGLRLDF